MNKNLKKAEFDVRAASCSGRYPRCSGFVALLLFIMAASAIDNTDSGLDRVRELFDEGKILHARMTHELFDSYTGERQVVQGVLWISKEKYKIRTDQQTVLVDGKTSMVYNKRQNKLIISEYEPEEDDFAPSRFFSDTDEIFHLADVRNEGDITTFLLRSDDPFEIFTEVSIHLKPDLTPHRIDAIDQMDNYLSTSFFDAQYLEYSESLFVLHYPDSAEIIDLRK